MIYYCEHCDKLIAEEDIIFEDEGDVGYTHKMCPCCGTQDELVEADECRICGEPIKPETYICLECDSILREGLADTMHSLDCTYEVFQEACEWLWRKDWLDEI